MDDAKPSKSARKREQLALQALGIQLTGLSRAKLDSIDLDGSLLEAVVTAQSMRSHGALRRQRQLIGKLMRHADAAGIAASLDLLGREDRAANNLFHAAEEWRERVCAEGAPALAEFAEFAELTGRESGLLGSLLRELNNSVNDTARRAVRRRIFREIHDELTRTDDPSGDMDQDTDQDMDRKSEK